MNDLLAHAARDRLIASGIACRLRERPVLNTRRLAAARATLLKRLWRAQETEALARDAARPRTEPRCRQCGQRPPAQNCRRCTVCLEESRWCIRCGARPARRSRKLCPVCARRYRYCPRCQQILPHDAYGACVEYCRDCMRARWRASQRARGRQTVDRATLEAAWQAKRAVIAQRYQAGEAPAAIATDLGLSERQIKRVIQQDVTRTDRAALRAAWEEKRAAIVQLYQAGETPEAIAAQRGVGLAYVRRVLRQAGMRVRGGSDGEATSPATSG